MKLDFFQTKSARIIHHQVIINQAFYDLIAQVVEKSGRGEEALTIFDLEEMLLAVPGIAPDFAAKIARVASNNGREYVSAHEIRRRAVELNAKSFKIAYFGFLMHHGVIGPKQLQAMRRKGLNE